MAQKPYWMKKLVAVLFGSCFLCICATAQYNRHIIEFKDKAGTPHTLSNPSTYLSQKAIDRRTKYAIAADSTDLPITPRYLDSIRSVANVTVLNWSKWMNQVAIQTSDAAALSRIQSFPFVKTVSSVAPRVRTGDNSDPQGKFRIETIEALTTASPARVSGTLVNYGQTFNQIHIHNGEFLHDRGFLGQGMTIAVLDGGFSSYKTNPAFDSIRLNGQVLGERDFVRNATNTDGFSGHGMNCLSAIAANRPGTMVGTAPKSNFWLFITEDVASEYLIEEHFWVVGAEHADSVGCDIISSSLGYQDFDDPSFDHPYSQRDGKTTMITKGANLAARKGMIVLNSAGNYGTLADQRRFISCPADGDSVVAVGAVNTSGSIAGFSSWGPNSAGNVKPNIVSVGQGTIIANGAGNPVSGNGTSFSNPNIAGLITCLWQAFPEYNNRKIIDAVQKSAHRYNNPDERFGYGIPDMRKAFYLLKSEKSQTQFGGTRWFRATPNPFDNQISAAFIADNSGEVKLYLKNAAGTKLDSAVFNCDSLDYKEHLFDNLGNLPGGIYFVQYKSAGKDSAINLRKGADLFTSDWIKAFPNPFDDAFYLYFKAQKDGAAHVLLYDSRGRLVSAKRNIGIQKDGIYSIEFPVAPKLNSGTYIIRFNDGTHRRSLKVVRQ